MIKINLLKLREEKKKETYRNQLIVAGIAIVGVLVVIFIMHLRINQKINNVIQKIKNTEGEIKNFEKVVGDVELFKKKRDDLEKKIKAIETLEKSKDLPARLLYTLAKTIPYQQDSTIPKKIQITNLNIKGTSIQLKGYALNEESLVFFITNLEQSGVFSNVVLASSTLVDKKGAKLDEFDITAVISQMEEFQKAGAVETTKKTSEPGTKR